MKTGTQTKKVDYSIMSDQECKTCGYPLKQNKVIQGHKICFVCFKIAQGKRYYNKSIKDVNGKITVVKFDRLPIQKANILKYK